MDLLGRYYTSDIFSHLLIDQFSIRSPKNIIDLGVGEGSLIKAAINRWINASYFAVDIDKKCIHRIKTELPFVKSFHLDTLKEEVSEKIQVINGEIDIAICNPPYLKIKNDYSYNGLFDRAMLSDFKKLKILTSDIVFFAKNLQLLKKSGELGIILPDSLITGKEFNSFRDAILKDHNLKAIIELPEKIFKKTEAKTHIIIIQKGRTTGRKSPLFLANRAGEIVDEIEVDKNSLCERMDFKFHVWKNKIRPLINVKVLGDIKVEIKRGTLSHAELKSSSDNFIHTTRMVNNKINQGVRNHLKTNDKYLLTKKGDILLARVGRGCIGKVCMVGRGMAPISDCVYRIRVAKKYRIKIWNAFVSEEGQKWFKANSHGVCAKVISKKDLFKFPLR